MICVSLIAEKFLSSQLQVEGDFYEIFSGLRDFLKYVNVTAFVVSKSNINEIHKDLSTRDPGEALKFSINISNNIEVFNILGVPVQLQ